MSHAHSWRKHFRSTRVKAVSEGNWRVLGIKGPTYWQQLVEGPYNNGKAAEVFTFHIPLKSFSKDHDTVLAT